MNIVKELRKKKGIQQKELAISIGVSRPIVSEWESNKKDPSGDRLKRLAEYFGVDELVILGKGVVDLTSEVHKIPQTQEAIAISEYVDQMPKEQRDTVLNIVRILAEKHQNNNEKGDDE